MPHLRHAGDRQHLGLLQKRRKRDLAAYRGGFLWMLSRVEPAERDRLRPSRYHCTDAAGLVGALGLRLGAVMPLERDGGQAQFITHAPPSSGASLEPLLAWLAENMHRPVDLDEMARQAAMSSRTLSRRFREQTGTTLLQWLQTARARGAQSLLETTDLSIEQVATEAGFATATTFRDRFFRTVGLSPPPTERHSAPTPRCCEANGGKRQRCPRR
jgi:AraC-like DNA-binding protein